MTTLLGAAISTSVQFLFVAFVAVANFGLGYVLARCLKDTRRKPDLEQDSETG